MLNEIRAQIANVWKRMTNLQRVVMGLLIVVGIALISVFAWWASIPEYSVAFTGLAEADAGSIVEQLKAQNIPYQLQSGGTILVPKDQVYDVRMSMAKDGLPNGSTVGYELFNANTLGLTEFSQKVNYQRALEGELARTIESLDAVKGVRVHLVLPEQALFADQQQPSTASITIQLRPGRELDAGQVEAITNLVASSVEGLDPNNVVVVDTDGQMLSSGSAGSDLAGLTDDQQSFQRAYEAEIQSKVQDMLTQALGPNKSIVRVSAAMNWDQVETTTQTFDPTPIARSQSIVSETYTGAGAVPAGIPGTSSNLPSDTTPIYQTTGTQTAETSYVRNETTTNYEVTTAQTHTVVTPGQVKNISVSVLVDNVTDAATLDVLTNIATRAAGIDAMRGDQVTVQSIAFDRSYYETETAAIDQESQTNLYIQIGIWVAIGLVALLLVWFIMRLMNNLRLSAAQDVWTPLLGATQPLALSSGANGSRAAVGGNTQSRAAISAAPGQAAHSEPAPVAAPIAEAVAAVAYVSKQSQITPEVEQLQRALSRLIEQRPATAAEIIRLWIEEDGPRK